jgi:hypothetical protein
MGEQNPDSSYDDDFLVSLPEGQGACAFFAKDPDGDPTVVLCTFNIADDNFGREMRDSSIVVRVRAGVRALMAARRAAGGEGYTPLPG